MVRNSMRVRGTQAWRKLAKRTIAEEPICRLQLPGCTIRSDQADHIIPISIRPDLELVRANTQGVCRSCNRKRGNNPMSAVRPSTAPALAIFELG